jgi:hypothetical protein
MPDNSGYLTAAYAVVGVTYLVYAVALALRSRRR